MGSRLRTTLRRFGIITLMGLTIGLAMGYIATRYDWGFGYPIAIGLVLGCVYGIEIIDIVTAAYLSRRFEKYSRGKRLAFQMSSTMLIRILGWLLLVRIAGLIMGFNLFRWEVLIWLVIFVKLDGSEKR